MEADTIMLFNNFSVQIVLSISFIWALTFSPWLVRPYHFSVGDIMDFPKENFDI